MRKIHTIHDLKLEQNALEQKRLQLEKELRSGWSDISNLLSGDSNSFSSIIKKQLTLNLLSQSISFSAGMLSKKFGGKIGSKLFSWLK